MCSFPLSLTSLSAADVLKSSGQRPSILQSRPSGNLHMHGSCITTTAEAIRN